MVDSSADDPLAAAAFAKLASGQAELSVAERVALIQSSSVIPERVKADMIETIVRDDLAESSGVDPALAEAMREIDKHGYRLARKAFCNPVVLSMNAKTLNAEDAERARRVARHIEDYGRRLPWWKRLL